MACETPPDPRPQERIRFVLGGPERLFGIADASCSDDGTVSATMPTGPWLTGPGSTSKGSLGSLGVLADQVLGSANHVLAPPPWTWSVTISLSLDLVNPLPVDGQQLIATARAVNAGAGSAFAVGEIRTASGTLIAAMCERGRFVADGPLEEMFHSGGVDVANVQPDLIEVTSLQQLIGDVSTDRDQLAVAVGPEVANPRGGLHGGISIALADLVAAITLPSDLITTSIQLTYLRPLLSGAGPIELSAAPIHAGRSLSLLDVSGRRADDGKLVFRGSVTRQ